MEPISIEHETIFSGPFSIDQLWWIGGGLAGLLLLLTIRDLIFARKKWVVPFLLLFRCAACAGILLALAAPAKLTRETFEKGEKNSLGIYLDTSASTRLRDPYDGKGYLHRWAVATGREQNSQLPDIDFAHTGIEVASALAKTAATDSKKIGPALELLKEQLQSAEKTLTKQKSQLPYPSLCDETITLLKTILNKELPEIIENPDPNKTKALLTETSQIGKRIAVLANELSRIEEAEAKDDENTSLPTRLEWAGEVLRELENHPIIAEQDAINIHRFRFDRSIAKTTERWNVQSMSESDESSATNLNDVLAKISQQARSGQIDAAILLTDSIHNHPDKLPLEVPPELREFPLFLIPEGGDYQLKDSALWRVSAPTSLSQGDFLSVDCLVGAQGYAGKTTRVQLLENGVELDSVEVTFASDDDDQQVRFATPVRSAGSHRYEISLSTLPDELQTRNNREFFDVDVYTGNLDVMLIDGWPRWETRYLSNLLKRDDKTNHREILFAPEPPFPLPSILTSPFQLGSYQVMMLGEVGTDYIGELEAEAIENYVNNGGNLIIIAGRQSMPANYVGSKLEDVLPITLHKKKTLPPGTAIQLIPTPAGRRIAALSLEDDPIQNDAVWKLSSSLLSLTELSPYNQPKPGAQVILEAQSKLDKSQNIPYIIWHRYGAGRAFYFSSPTTHHLRYRFGDRYHYRFWGQFLRWATVAEMKPATASIYLKTDEKRYKQGDTPVVQLEIRGADGAPMDNAQIAVEVSSAGQKSTQYRVSKISGEPGQYTATLPPVNHGEYNIKVIGKTADQLIAAASKEGEDDTMILDTSFIVEASTNSEDGERTGDWETAHQIINQTGGAILAPGTLDSLLEILARNQTKNSSQKTTEKPLWNRWPLFLFILLFLCVEWAGRKYSGLI